jgi:hypothetical protein
MSAEDYVRFLNVAYRTFMTAFPVGHFARQCTFCGVELAPEQNVRSDHNGGTRCVPCDNVAQMDFRV